MSSVSKDEHGVWTSIIYSSKEDLLSYHNFDIPGANVLPFPCPNASTIRSTVSSNHTFPSSDANHSPPLTSSSPSASALPSSKAFLRPKTWLVTCGPTPVCARRHATAMMLVSTRPTFAPVAGPSAGGSAKSAPYSEFKMKTGRSGCDSPSLVNSLVSNGW
jgi:hypothetical protein